MIEYVANGWDQRHVLDADIRDAFATIRTLLETATTCRAPASVDGTMFGRKQPAPSFADLAARAASLAIAEIPGTLELVFQFHLVDPATGQPLANPAPGWRSNAKATLRHGRRSGLQLLLTWPVDGITEPFLRSYDAVFGVVGPPLRDGLELGGEKLAFDRAGYAVEPIDPTDLALFRAVLEAPTDEGPRMAYADWLLERGDPLGEVLVLQLELARKPDARRARAMQERLAELVARHGARWPRVLVPR
jgi:uncharacterized protein (TIGR02996 family)